MRLPQRLTWPLIPLHQTLQRRVHDLNYLFLEITQRCDLRCRHCGSDCIRDATTPDLPVDVALRAARDIKDRLRPRHLTVAITGGEPLCHPGLFDLGRGLADLEFPWGTVTNGWGWNADKVARALDAGLRTLTVSLDGLEAEHDWLRGRPGSFRRASATIAAFVRSGRLNAMDVVTCVNRRNLEQLPALGRHLADLGVPAWRVFNIAPIGRAKDDPDLHFDTPRFHRLLDIIEKLRNVAKPRISMSEASYLGPHHNFRVRGFPFFCRAGVSIGGIMVDGGIMACPNIDRALVQGNAHHESFVDVWEQRFQPFRRRQWLRTGPCADCSQWRHCQGGPLHLRRDGTDGPLVCHWRDHGLD